MIEAFALDHIEMVDRDIAQCAHIIPLPWGCVDCVIGRVGWGSEGSLRRGWAAGRGLGNRAGQQKSSEQ